MVKEMKAMMRTRKIFCVVLLALSLTGCATGLLPVREGLKENLSVPAGKIEGNQFTGIRYPFKVTCPAGWKMSLEFPDFMVNLGYDKPSPYDKEQTELYLFNPSTQSNVQIDLTPADAYTVFNQEKIRSLTVMGGSSFREELEHEYGKEVEADVNPPQPFKLNGAQYAAKSYATYSVKGSRREQGWIYAFSEPYQMFILYLIMDKEGTKDQQDVTSIIDSFEFLSKK